MKVTEEEGDRKTESLSKVWVDYEGQRYCTETDLITPEGGGAKFITIQIGSKVYVLNTIEKTAQEIPASEEGKMPLQSGGLPDYKRFGGVRVGTDTVAGYETDIYEYIKFEDTIESISVFGKTLSSSDEGTEELEDIMARSARQSKVRAWIWRGPDVALKTVVDFGPLHITTETVHIAVNVDIPERVFTIPKGYTMKKIQR